MDSANDYRRRKVLPHLRETLSALFPSDADQRRVVSEVFKNGDSVAFGGTAVNVWHSILTEAHKVGIVDTLLTCPSVRYYAEQHEGLVYCELLWVVSQIPWNLGQLYEIYEVSILTAAVEKAPAASFEGIVDLIAHIATAYDQSSVIRFAVQLPKMTDNNEVTQKLQLWIDKAKSRSKNSLQTLNQLPDHSRKTLPFHINTDGGMVIIGNINSGGDLIGRDKRETKASELENSDTQENNILVVKLQDACNKILAAFAHPRHTRTLPAIEQWLNQIPHNLRTHPKLQAMVLQVYPQIVERFVVHAKNHLKQFKDTASRESEIQARLNRLFQEFSTGDAAMRPLLDDLNVVVDYLFHTGAFHAHEFVDVSLAGAYTNLAWADKARRGELAQLLEDLQNESLADHDLYWELLVGAFRCEQIVQTTLYQLPTLLSEVADDYITQRYRETYKEQYPWWTGVTGAIDITDPNKPEIAHWCEGKRNEKARYEDNRQRIELGLPPRRLLWPLELSNDANKPPDANYDFPAIAESIDDIATQPAYTLGSGVEARSASAFELCQDYLSQYTHHIVTGNQRSGKSWLRLYLEYFSLMTDKKLLPLFYFAPASLAYQTTIQEIVEHLARAVANQLFADLLVRAGNRTSTNDPWRASRVAIAPFLRRYGYTPPNNHDSLVQPLPPKHLLDIELAYGNSYLATIYAQMKQELDALSATAWTATDTIEEILDDMQRAIELVGYQSMFVFIDNWDDLPAAPRRRLLNYVLQPELLAQLYQRGIFLKLFMPEVSNTGLAHFDMTCAIQRDVVHRLTLYTYRESNGEPRSI